MFNPSWGLKGFSKYKKNGKKNMRDKKKAAKKLQPF